MNARRRLADSADLTAIEAGGLQAFQPYDSVPQALEAVAAQHAGRPAISWLPSADITKPAQRWTYAELMRRVRQAANLLHGLGVDDEHAVALLLPAVPQAWLVLLGGETAGRVCPINYLLDTAHIAALVTAANARVLVALAPCAEVDIAGKATRLRGLCPGLERVLWVGGDPPNVDNADGADHFDTLLAAQPADALVFERLRERLAKLGLDGRVALRVEDEARGLAVCFTAADADAAAIARLMAPFALTYRIEAATT